MRTIQIIAASRLHFGLLAPASRDSRRFGGVGVMVEHPSVQLTASSQEHFSVHGFAADRVREFAKLWSAFHGLDSPPKCRLSIDSLARMHAGLGIGTQLGLSVARALCELYDKLPTTPPELARSVGRGQRSAVGTYGFFYGGLIAEPGKQATDTLAPLELRLELPTGWRWVLVCPRDGGGLHGDQERRVFSELQQSKLECTPELPRELHDRLLPAARQGDFQAFSDSIYRFGYQSGMCFASIQGGAYNGPRLQQIVETIRSLGVRGVGQSSWGPTIFALCPDEPAAQNLVDQLWRVVMDADIAITATANHGARISDF